MKIIYIDIQFLYKKGYNFDEFIYINIILQIFEKNFFFFNITKILQLLHLLGEKKKCRSIFWE